MKFSIKMFLEIILKVTKNQGFTLALEDKFFEKLQGSGSWGVQIAKLSASGINISCYKAHSYRTASSSNVDVIQMPDRIS